MTGGYKSLIVYQQAVVIYDLTGKFCQKHLRDFGTGMPTRRTVDQMIRSLEKKFINEGGYSENLFNQRLKQRKNN
ncbi:MAG: hypothetical protein AAB600_04640 [Patescibacteria group bacterium]